MVSKSLMRSFALGLALILTSPVAPTHAGSLELRHLETVSDDKLERRGKIFFKYSIGRRDRFYDRPRYRYKDRRHSSRRYYYAPAPQPAKPLKQHRLPGRGGPSF